MTNLVAIAVSANSPPVHHILPISSIVSFSLISAATTTSPASLDNVPPPLTSLDTAALLKRADAAVARLKEAAARKNKSVSKEAQDIFDGISRTLPTRWDGTNMVVNDGVVINAPYRAEDCRAGAGQQAVMLGRVKKVVSKIEATPELKSNVG